jgi:DeoR/GlpR family transcriptional regulator of sugar metabolism
MCMNLQYFFGIYFFSTEIHATITHQMLKIERQEYIFRKLNLHNKVLSSDLSVEINVSEDTIRRDLNELAESGKIIKVHGGALSKSFHSSFYRSDIYKLDAKKIIAQKAIGLIKDGMFVLTSGGTTILEMCRMLPPNLHATFFTPSIPAASEYMLHPNIELILIGGKISRNSHISIGAETINKINEIKPDLCILGINAIDFNKGITDNDWDVVQIKKKMIEVSQKTIALCISEKIDTEQRIKICDYDAINILITELDPADKLLGHYRNKKISII